MITLNGSPLNALWELPVGSTFTFGSGTYTVVKHNCGESDDRVRVRSLGGAEGYMPDDSLVRLVKAPPTWYP